MAKNNPHGPAKSNPRGLLYGAAGSLAMALIMILVITFYAAVPGMHTPAAAQDHPRLTAKDKPIPRHVRHAGHANAPPASCDLIVPADPLTPAGLATPYQLTGPNGMSPQASGCTMANAANMGAFAQATIVTPAGQLLVYDPLVVTAGTTPAAPPVVPAIPDGSTVGIWTGFNGNVLNVTGPGGGNFVQGADGSSFGQVAADNGAAFFAAAAAAQVTIPALGMANDGLPCPSTRDFSLVDQDPSDNVTTTYILTAGGQTASSGSGVAGTVIGNGSDNRLLTHFVDPALGCTPFQAPDLSNPGTMSAAQALDELSAMNQAPPVALVPPNDPMTTVGVDADVMAGVVPHAGNLSVNKTNAYRVNIAGQPPLMSNRGQDAAVAAAKQYCNGLKTVAPTRLAMDAGMEAGPSPAAGMTLAQFMQARFQASLTLLNCNEFK
jgi:hypothetical protein